MNFLSRVNFFTFSLFQRNKCIHWKPFIFTKQIGCIVFYAVFSTILYFCSCDHNSFLFRLSKIVVVVFRRNMWVSQSSILNKKNLVKVSMRYWCIRNKIWNLDFPFYTLLTVNQGIFYLHRNATNNISSCFKNVKGLVFCRPYWHCFHCKWCIYVSG